MRRPSFAPRALALLAVLALAVSQSSCVVAEYGRDRLMDIPDIIDLKYGVGIGVGAKVELTTYFGAGGGLAALGYTREWYGRRSTIMQSKYFVHFGIGGVDGGKGAEGWPNDDEPFGDAKERADVNVLFANITALRDHNIAPRGEDGPEVSDLWNINAPPSLDRWRFGGEFVIPLIHFGIYLNLGEIVDFIGGWVTWDPAYDDGVSFHELYYDYRLPLEGEADDDEHAGEHDG